MNVIHFLLLLFLNRFKEVKWNDKTIVVMDDVKIEPSYEEDKCSGSEQLLEHIIKIVSMFCNHGDYSWLKRNYLLCDHNTKISEQGFWSK